MALEFTPRPAETIKERREPTKIEDLLGVNNLQVVYEQVMSQAVGWNENGRGGDLPSSDEYREMLGRLLGSFHINLGAVNNLEALSKILEELEEELRSALLEDANVYNVYDWLPAAGRVDLEDEKRKLESNRKVVMARTFIQTLLLTIEYNWRLNIEVKNIAYSQTRESSKEELETVLDCSQSIKNMVLKALE